MTITNERTAIDRTRLQKGIRYRVVYIAGLLAIFIVFAVQTGTRYVLNDWSRARLERLISIAFHRPITLGKTSWSLGLNGLVIGSQHILIKDRPDYRDAPFITADYAELGIPLVPMLAGDLQVRSLKLKKPQVWLVQVSDKTWNFFDLKEYRALKNIALLDMRQGAFTILDNAHTPPARWSAEVFSSAQFHLERPFQNQQWPFSLSFKMPHGQYVSEVLISGIGNGNIEDWRINEHTFHIAASKLNPADFRSLFPTMPYITGLVSVELDGEGIPNSDFRAHGSITAPTLTVNAPHFGEFRLQNAVTSGNFAVQNNKMAWSSVVIKTGGFALHSDGSVLDWNTKHAKFDATLTASTEDLGKVAALVPAQLLPKQLLPPGMLPRVAADRKHIISVATALAPARLTGKGSLFARLTGPVNHPAIYADVVARDMLMSELAQLRPFRRTPILGAIGASPSTNLDVTLHVVPEGTSRIRSGSLNIGNSHILLSGYFFLDKDQTHISMFGRNVNLADITERIKSPQSRRKLNDALGLAPDAKIDLGGTTDLNGTIDIAGESQTIRFLAMPHSARASLNNGAFDAENVNGVIFFTGDRIYLANLTGKVNGGAFSLDGAAPATPGGKIDLVYRGKSLNLSAVLSAAAALKFNTPLLQRNHLRGTVENVYLVVRGTADHPDITFSGSPRDLAFQKPGQPGAVSLNGGTVRYEHNQLFLRQLAGTMGRGAFRINGSIAGVNNNNLVLNGTGIDISNFRQALLDLDVKAPEISQTSELFGTLRYGSLVLKTDGANKQFSMVAAPENVYYQPPHMPRIFVLNGGLLTANQQQVNLGHVSGKLGEGSFVLNGNWHLVSPQGGNISLSARNLDVSNIKVALQALKVHSPLLAQQQLFGRINSVVMNVRGRLPHPNIALLARPQDISFEPYGTRRSLHLKGGVVSFKNDQLRIADMYVVNGRSNAAVGLTMDQLSKQSQLRELHLSSAHFDIGDLNAYLSSSNTPAAVRNQYRKFLRVLNVERPHGAVSGRFDYITEGPVGSKTTNTPQFNLKINAYLHDAGFRTKSLVFDHLNAHLFDSGTNLVLSNLNGDIDKSSFVVNGRVQNYRNANRTWTATLLAQLSPIDLSKLLVPRPIKEGTTRLAIQSVSAARNIPLEADISGNMQATTVNYKSRISPETALAISVAGNQFVQPAKAVDAEGSIVYSTNGSSGVPQLTFDDNRLIIGKTLIAWNGSYLWHDAQAKSEPSVNLTISIPNPVAINDLLPLSPDLKLPELVANASGQVAGSVQITGPISHPKSEGHLQFSNIAVPGLNISGISGTVDIPDVLTAINQGSLNTGTSNLHSRMNLALNNVRLGKIALQNVHADLGIDKANHEQIISLNCVVADLDDGKVSVTGKLYLSRANGFQIKASIIKADVRKIMTQLYNAPNELSGLLTGSATISGSASNKKTLISSLVGSGRFRIDQGNIQRFGELVKKVNQLNLLREGLVGLNLSNVMSALSAHHTGKFNTFSGDFNVGRANVSLTKLAFNGDQIKMRAEGIVDLVEEKAQFRVFGSIPRISPMAKSPPARMSVATVAGALTDGASEHLPAIPVIGDFNYESPRPFTFVLAGDLNAPDSFSKSIYKTFHWLPERRPLTHPVFGISAGQETVPQ